MNLLNVSYTEELILNSKKKKGITVPFNLWKKTAQQQNIRASVYKKRH